MLQTPARRQQRLVTSQAIEISSIKKERIFPHRNGANCPGKSLRQAQGRPARKVNAVTEVLLLNSTWASGDRRGGKSWSKLDNDLKFDDHT